MSNPKSLSDNDDELIRRVIDQRVSRDEFFAFNERLRTNSELRRRYIYQADLEARLFEEFGETKTYASASNFSTPHSTQHPKTPSSWLTTGLAVALAATIAWIALDRQPGQPNIAENDEAQRVPLDSDITDDAFRPSSLVIADDAAVVVRLENVEGTQMKVGTRLKPGVLKLKQGFVQLEFVSGAVLALAGPAELHLKSKTAATLISGLASARVPDRAKGFVLNAPDTAIVDLGTEFSVRINDSGTSEVEVTSGEVQLSLIGDDGNTLLSQLVGETEGIRVDGREQKLVSIKNTEINSDTKVGFPKITIADKTPLNVTNAYVNAIRKEAPLLYWRFETEKDGTVANEMGNEFSASIFRAGSDFNSISLDDSFIRFEAAESPRYLFTEQPIIGLNRGPYTVEFWMKPDDLSRATCAGLYPDDTAINHLNVIEIATETELVHDPGAIRFLHRNPPARSLRLGTNVYTRGVCIPGQWQHVVAVRTDDALELFFNGQLARRVSIENADSNDELRLIVGQLNLFNTMRQFVGAIDEFVIYQHALTPSKIQNHYQLVASETNN